MFIFFSLLFKKVQKVYCSTFTAYCSLFKKTHCHSIVIHSHTIVSICNAVRKQLCDHCYYCSLVFLNLINLSSQSYQSCLLNLVFSIFSIFLHNLLNLVFSIFSILFSQSHPLTSTLNIIIPLCVFI